ncbi:Uncharacterised protein [Streptococcus suis]|nr:hypothetical protein SSU10_01806 [Streptococcus suis]CYT59824.1 Uncharacterised protein [Streptococcus suis]CYT63266.1 Uncharacterised protein [Streptococcus suis]CYT71320.1 Uncharacterised protein [Streptococcus suis]CYU12540.1 Uncharacterised protein [Streptococcus suis]
MIFLVPYSFCLTLVGSFCEGTKGQSRYIVLLLTFFTSAQEELRFWISRFKQSTGLFELALPYFIERQVLFPTEAGQKAQDHYSEFVSTSQRSG